MPFEVVDQRGSAASSHFFEDIRFSSERQIGFWKQHTLPERFAGTDGRIPISGSKLVSSLPLEKLSTIGASPMDYAELQQSIILRDHEEKLSTGEGSTNMSNNSWNSVAHPKSWSNLSVQPTSYALGRNGTGTAAGGSQWESSLFSSSLSEIFTRKLRLQGSNVQSNELPNSAASPNEEEELLESIKEIEAQTIGNLLPAEDDLIPGMSNDLGNNVRTSSGDDLEDFDLFSSSGGMELEGDNHLGIEQRNAELVGGVACIEGDSNGSIMRLHPYSEHSSRTLLVRDISNDVEDSEIKALFEQYGDIQALYMACKHRGFIMISYYDIRAAQKAMRGLQNKSLRHTKLDIHYSIPKGNPSAKDINQGTVAVFNLDTSISNDELRRIFGVFGEIKEIRETSQKSNHKLIEYFDIRSAEAALSAVNRGEIGGKQIKLDPCYFVAAKRLSPQPLQELDEHSFCQSPFDELPLELRAFASGVIAPSSTDNGSSSVLHSAVQSRVGGFFETHHSSSFANNLRPPAATAFVGKPLGFHDSNHLMDEIKFVNHAAANFHPHSLPDGIPSNSTSTMGGLANSVGARMTEGINSRHVQGVGSNGLMMELRGGNGSSLISRHHRIWNNAASSQQRPMIWPNSPSFVNGVHAHQLPHMAGFRGPPSVLSGAPAHHHVGSAPAVNPSLWDRRHAYLGDSPDTSSFHLGSLGSVGFPGTSLPHPIEIPSPNIFSPRIRDTTKSAGLRSPQQICHVFPRRNPMLSMPTSFDSPNERVRNLSHRRLESNYNNSDRKQYELDIERILRGEDTRTTLMIKNIPNKYTSKMLLAAIDEHCRGIYDFIYLPIDFKNKCNVGYAFINIIDPQRIIQFYKVFNGKKWEKFNSEKVAYLAYARIQGKAALIAHFQNSSLMNEDKRCRPILFHTDGPNAGDPEPFPMGTNIRLRLGKHRANGSEGNHRHGSPCTFVNGEDLINGSDSSTGSD